MDSDRLNPSTIMSDSMAVEDPVHFLKQQWSFLLSYNLSFTISNRANRTVLIFNSNEHKMWGCKSIAGVFMTYFAPTSINNYNYR